jgi:hypothetical protein
MGAITMGAKGNDLAIGTASGRHTSHKIAHPYGLYAGCINVKSGRIVATGTETLAEVCTVVKIGLKTMSVNAAAQLHIAKVVKVLGYLPHAGSISSIPKQAGFKAFEYLIA